MSALKTNAILMQRLLETIEQDVSPLTEAAVKQSNKVFGAALLNKSDLTLTTYLAENNNEGYAARCRFTTDSSAAA